MLLAVGALLFGSVHPWAYWLSGVAAVSIAAWIVAVNRAGGRSMAVRVPAVLIVLPVLCQLVPLTPALLETVAPTNLVTLQTLEVGVASRPAHSLSVAPALTAATLGFLVVGMIWIGAFSRGLERMFRPQEFVVPLVGWGVAIALFALIQKATFNGKIFWFWESAFGVSANYFGPFVNRNHFAGWMLLATALGAGHLLGLLTIVGRSIKPGWRERILWLGTPEASRVTLTTVAVGVMATSVVWSLSRSGVAGATFAFLILAFTSVRRMTSPTRARMALLAIGVLVASVATWKGLDTIAAAYGDTRTLEWRFDLWRDSLAPLRDFFVLGSGLNTYGKVMLVYPQTDIAVHAQQAHNDYLQLAIEGGLLVAVPWLIAVAMLVRRIVRAFKQPQDEQTWWVRMGAVAGICGIALQEASEFSLQVPAVALLFATALAIALHTPTPCDGNVQRLRRTRTRQHSDRGVGRKSGVEPE